MILHDFRCTGCGKVEEDVLSEYRADIGVVAVEPGECSACSGQLEKTILPRRQSHGWSEKDKIVIFRDPGTGELHYPGRNDYAPQLQRMERDGLQKIEIRSLQEYRRVEKKLGLRADRDNKAVE
jgi:hypothetical protein